MIIAVTGFVMMVVVGCGQGAGNTPSGSTDLTTSAGSSGERATTEQSTYVEMHGLQCRSGDMNAAIFDYAVGAEGEKASRSSWPRATSRRASRRVTQWRSPTARKAPT